MNYYYIFNVDTPAPSPPATLCTNQPTSASISPSNTLPRPISVSFPLSPIQYASTPTSIKNQSSTGTPTIAISSFITSNTSKTTSLCRPKIQDELLSESFKCKMKVHFRDRIM